MRIYIAGKITGLDPAEAERLFTEAETAIEKAGHMPQKLNDDGHCTRCESLPRHTLARIEERTNDRQILLIVILIAAVLSGFGWAMQTLFGGVK